MALHTAEEILEYLSIFGDAGDGAPTQQFARQTARSYLDASQHGAHNFTPLDVSKLPSDFVKAFRDHAEDIARKRQYFEISEGDHEWLPSSSTRVSVHAHARAEARKLVTPKGA